MLDPVSNYLPHTGKGSSQVLYVLFFLQILEEVLSLHEVVVFISLRGNVHFRLDVSDGSINPSKTATGIVIISCGNKLKIHLVQEKTFCYKYNNRRFSTRLTSIPAVEKMRKSSLTNRLYALN